MNGKRSVTPSSPLSFYLYLLHYWGQKNPEYQMTSSLTPSRETIYSCVCTVLLTPSTVLFFNILYYPLSWVNLWILFEGTPWPLPLVTICYSLLKRPTSPFHSCKTRLLCFFRPHTQRITHLHEPPPSIVRTKLCVTQIQRNPVGSLLQFYHNHKR